MSAPLTNIRVFVQWTEQTVFAGEDIECEITFKNVATAPIPSRTSLHPSSAAGNGNATGNANGFAQGGERPRKVPSVHNKNGSASPRPRPQKPPQKGHKTTLSLNVPPSSAHSQRTSESWTAPVNGAKQGKGHNRSVSIISIGASESSTIGDFAGNGSVVDRPRKSKGHGRSASLQIVPRRNGVHGGPPSGMYRLYLCGRYGN